jgi:SAM-dependent methyltransferase
MAAKADELRERVRGHYAKAALAASREPLGCCGSGYSADELSRIPEGAVLGLGSGNPVRLAAPREGEVVVDLGSGAGVDVFLAADLVGPSGRAIGVDMTPEMVAKARALAAEHGIGNAEFHESLMEHVPLADATADLVVSNCVINLSPDKAAVFHEAYRVLRPGGRLVVSDLVKEKPFELADVCGCVGGAMVRGEYLDVIRAAGFRDVAVLEEQRWPTGDAGMPASSLTVRAIKPKEVNP